MLKHNLYAIRQGYTVTVNHYPDDIARSGLAQPGSGSYHVI